MELVARESGGQAARWTWPLVCNGQRQSFGYSNIPSHWQLHLHVHDPDNCGDSIFPWRNNCKVLGSMQITINA